jgi:hypothetical protein
MVKFEEIGYTDCQLLANKLIDILRNNGMTMVYPVAFTATTYKATLETTISTNTVAGQPWRIQINSDSIDTLQIIVGTDIQLSNTGTYAYNDDMSINGHIGIGVNPDDTKFIDRTRYGVGRTAFPMSYMITIADRGIVLSVWEPSTDNLTDPSTSFVVVQRSVNNRTGIIRTTGKAPVYCVYGIYRPTVEIANKFVVREVDVFRPTNAVVANADSPDSFRVIGTNSIVAITEESNYVIFFPNKLNTSRYAYPQDDLDMLAYTSADVIAEGSITSIPVYNEPTLRNYKALSATGIDNTKMRILLQTT